MKIGLATVITVVALLAPVGPNMTSAVGHESEQVAREGVWTIHVADDSATVPSASANRNSRLSPNEAAGTPTQDDPESLRLELIACLLTMLVVSAGALLAICYFDSSDRAIGRAKEYAATGTAQVRAPNVGTGILYRRLERGSSGRN